MSAPPGWGIGETARRLGHYAWVEQRLFQVLGDLAGLGNLVDAPGSPSSGRSNRRQAAPGKGGSGTDPSAEDRCKAALVCLSHADHHAWHAELWRERIPLFGGQDLESLIVPPSRHVAELMEQLAGVDGLVGVYRVVLPRMVVMYGMHLMQARTVADAWCVRTLDLVLADEVRDWREGEALLQSSLLRSGDEVRRAASTLASCEEAWVRGGDAWGRGA